MEELFKDAYFGKSFMMLGDSLPHCFNCSYCRANDNEEKHFHILPSELNPLFKKIPVAVNIFYGDPMLQIDNTLSYLDRLEEAKHEGPVIIITKGDLTKFPSDRKYNLDLHFGLSTFGVDSKYDGGSMERFIGNLNYARDLCCGLPYRYKYSIEFRPIIKNINSSREVIENIIKIAREYDTGIGYCGLQMSPTLRKQLKEEGINFEPFEDHEFGMKKYVGNEVTEMFQERNKKCFEYYHSALSSYFPFSFKKTSCLIAWKHGLDRDPNAHYYRPNEVGCYSCPMEEKCMTFKNNLLDKLDIGIPFDYEIINKDKHICGLVKLGICKFPSDDCKNLSGKFIKIKDKITTTDVRIIKWLTGYTVDADFIESPYMSKKWIV